ncbi:hypothetical protein ACMXYX_08100 [Neptuniibacter sp. QD72_48]|uniref:hypothetical protein n=1 Tax=Neptuniibacter sp. QD72_48 TaxID=3398214 RepID=UPI0039F4CF4A
MSTRLGAIAIILSSCGIALILLCLNAHMSDDGINLKLAPPIAELLGIISDSTQSEPSYRPSSLFELSETAAIYIIGGIGISLGLVSVGIGFFSIKRGELPLVSFGAISLGVAPIILVSIKIALGCFVVIGITAIWYRNTVNTYEPFSSQEQ